MILVYTVGMWNLFVFIFSFVFVWLRILRPGGARTIAAENIALRKQLIALSRHRKRSPNHPALNDRKPFLEI